MTVKKIGYTRLESEVSTLKDSGCQEVFLVAAENATRDYFLEFANNHQIDTLVLVNFNSISNGLNIVRLTKLLEQVECKLHIIETNMEEPISSQAYLEVVMLIGRKEMDLIRKRTREGMDHSRKEGRIGGRPALANETVQKIQYLFRSKKMTYREVAAACEVSIGSVSKYVTQKMEPDC